MSDAYAPSPLIKIRWLFWTLAAFSIFAVIAYYSSVVTWNTTDFDQKRAKERYATLKALQADETKTLTTADWIDQKKGTVRIPIEEAMLVEVETLKTQTTQIGSALPVAAPAPAPAPAKPAADVSAAPATNAAPSAPAKPNK